MKREQFPSGLYFDSCTVHFFRDERLAVHLYSLCSGPLRQQRLLTIMNIYLGGIQPGRKRNELEYQLSCLSAPSDCTRTRRERHAKNRSVNG